MRAQGKMVQPRTLEQAIAALTAALRAFEDNPDVETATNLCLISKTAFSAYYCGFVTGSASHVAVHRIALEELLRGSEVAFEKAQPDLDRSVRDLETYREHIVFRVKMFETLYSEGVRGVRALLKQRRERQSAA